MSYLHPYNLYTLTKSKEVNRVYWCNTLATLGVGVATIFVPIFLLKSGRSFMQVLTFLLLQQLFAAGLQYPASRLFRHIHAKIIMAGGTLVYGLFMLMLVSYHHVHWPLGWLALVWAVNRATYWAALHYIFSQSRTRATGGQQIAGFQALALSAAAIAPAVGGIVASYLGINYSYLSALLLLIGGAALMVLSEDSSPKAVIHLPHYQFKAMRRDALSNCCNGIVIAGEQTIWPLFIYAVVKSYAGVGILSSVVAITTIAITLHVGSRQKHREHYYIKRGLVTYSLTNIGRALAQSAPEIFGLNLLAGIGRSLYITPFMNRYYTHSDGPHRLGYITVMETAFGLGSATYFFILILLALLFSMKAVLAIGLALVAIFSLGVRLIR